MLNFKVFVTLIHCVICSIVLLGQSNNSLAFKNWKKQDGFPSNHIYSIVKDKLGFVWIATDGGLCRYDGPNLIKVYRQIEEGFPQTNSLRSNNIRSLHCDEEGYLWIATRHGGLSRLNPLTNEWVTFRHDPNDESTISNDEVIKVYGDSKNRIWVGTEKGLNLFNRSTTGFTRFKLFDSNNEDDSNKAVLTINEDDQGWIWVGTWAGGMYLLLTDEDGNFKHTRQFKFADDKGSNNVWSLYQDTDGRHWVGTHGTGLFLMKLPKSATNRAGKQNWEPVYHSYTENTKNAINLQSNAIQSILQDQFNDLWIGSTNGLFRVSYDKLPPLNSEEQVPITFESFLFDADNSWSLGGNNITKLLLDDQGLIWIATSDGLSQYNWSSNQFKNIKFPDFKYNVSFASNFFIDKENIIWLGTTDGGLLRYRFEDGVLKPITDSVNHLLVGNNVQTIHSPDEERLFVATKSGVTVFETETLNAKKYPFPESLQESMKNLSITSVFVDKNEFIWLGTKIGLIKINPETNVYTLFEPDINDETSISDHPVNHVMQDSKGAIWVATYKGLNRVSDPSKEKLVFEKFFFNAEHPEKGPMVNEIMYLKEVDHYLYIGTMSGICRYEYSTGLFKSINKSNQKYWVRSIEKGLKNNLWIGTNEGVFHFNADTESFRSFNKQDGLTNTAFQLGASFKDRKGNLYFSYLDGFTTFSPEKLQSNEIPPPIYFTELERMTHEGTILREGVIEDQIELNHNDYRISLNPAILNYNRADKNKYLYRLKGFEDKWNEGKVGTPIVYTSLAPKKYVLEVKASNNDGVWNEKGASITIIQHPPYWQTWWFYILSAVVFLSVVGVVFSWYTNNIRKHNEELQAYNQNLNNEIAERKRVEAQLSKNVDELKRSNKDLEQFAYIASHDLKEPIRVIGNFSGLLARRYGDKLDENAIEYIGFIGDGVRRMSNLINSLLTFSTVGRKDVKYDSIDLKAVIENKLADLSQLIKDKNAVIQLEDLPTIIGQREQLGMVFFNLINNAIKFNKAKKPFVIIREEKRDSEFWKFSVEDNGIGIEDAYKDKIFGIFKRLHGKKEYEGTGIGLSVCQKIIIRHQGKIWFESEPDKGTTFFFTIKKKLPLEEESMELEKEEMTTTF